MRSHEFITELRQGLMNYISNKFPNMPEYVAQDLIYNNSKSNPAELIKVWIRYYGSMKWDYNPDFKMSYKILDSDSVHSIEDNVNRSVQPDKMDDKNASRFAKQRELIGKQGISKLPIILEESREEPGKFTLLEGMHRTTENFRVSPNGFTCAAYVGYRTKNTARVAEKTPPSLWQKFTASVKNLLK